MDIFVNITLHGVPIKALLIQENAFMCPFMALAIVNHLEALSMLVIDGISLGMLHVIFHVSDGVHPS